MFLFSISIGSSKFAIGQLILAIAVCIGLFAFVTQVDFSGVFVSPKSVGFLTKTCLCCSYLIRDIAVSIKSVQGGEQHLRSLHGLLVHFAGKPISNRNKGMHHN